MNFLRELWEAVIYFIFPPRCPNCKKIVDEPYRFCAACVKKIFRVDFYDRPPAPIDKVLRVTKYRDGSRELLYKLKFDNNLNVVPALKKILDDVSNREEVLNFLRGINFAVIVPLHDERLNERGFNQTEIIFEDFFAKNNLPVKNILKRIRSTPKLYKFGKADREKILQGVFEAVDHVDLSGKKILIVDDIFTTGTTCKECAKVLKSLGADKIFVLAFAADFGDNLNHQT